MYRQGKWIGSKRVRRALASLLRQVKPLGKTEARIVLGRMQCDRLRSQVIYLAYNHNWLYGRSR